jgi:hypothetical protein
MEKYIQCQRLEARPMTRGDYRAIADPDGKLDSLGAQKSAEEGYLVRFDNGFESWRPKAIFENMCLPMGRNRLEVVPAGEEHPFNDKMVTPDMVTDLLDRSDVKLTTIEGKITHLAVTLPSGFILTDTCAVVDPANYNEEVGRKICMQRIYDKTYELLGFLLQTAVGGV